MDAKKKVSARIIAIVIAAAALVAVGLAIRLVWNKQHSDNKQDEPAYRLVDTGSAEIGSYATLVLGMGAENVRIYLEKGESLSASQLPAPDIAGMEFLGWYLDDEREIPFTFDAISAGMTLYADYVPSDMKVAAYQKDMASDAEFVLFSAEELTEQNLSKYVLFEDIYGGDLKISMREAENTSSDEGYMYCLYAKDGFAPGQLYGFTVLKPAVVRFVSADGQSLVGNSAVQLSFRIKEQDNHCVVKADVSDLSSNQIKELNPLGDGKFTALFASSVNPKKGMVFQNKAQQGTFYKVLSIDNTGEDGTWCTLELADGGDVWEEYFVSSSTEGSKLELIAGGITSEDTVAREITTSLGMAAYVDAVLDGVKHSDEVLTWLADVSAEDYDRVMGLTAVDLGFGPEELQEKSLAALNFKADMNKYGKLTFAVDDNGVVCLKYESKEITIKLGKSQKAGLEASVKINISISETAEIYTCTKMYAKGTKGIKEDFVHTSTITDSTTDFQFTAEFEIGKAEDDNNGNGNGGNNTGNGNNAGNSNNGNTGNNNNNSSNDKTQMNTNSAVEDYKPEGIKGKTDEEEEADEIKFELEYSIDGVADENHKALQIAMKDYDLWKYIEKMQEQIDKDNDLNFENTKLSDGDYITIYEKDLPFEFSATCTGIDSITISFGFKIEIAAKAKLDAHITYHAIIDSYTANGTVKYNKSGSEPVLESITLCSGKECISGSRVLQSDLLIGVTLEGGVGVRAMLGVTVRLGAFQMNRALSVYLRAEVGPYVELGGFFAYQYHRQDYTKLATLADLDGEKKLLSSRSTFRGGARIEVGIYVNVDAGITFLNKNYGFKIAGLKLPLWEKSFNFGLTSKIYGNFMDNEENYSVLAGSEDVVIDLLDPKAKVKISTNLSANMKNPSKIDRQRLPLVNDNISAKVEENTKVYFLSKHRSTISSDLYALEKEYEGKSSGLLLLYGNASGVYTEQLPATDYTFSITSILGEPTMLGDKRNGDGGQRVSRIIYSDPKDIAQFATISTDGVLTIKAGSPNMTVTVVVEAKGIDNIFGSHPRKTFTFTYSGKADSAKKSYKLNFYDTDGNLLVSDTIEEGQTPVEFLGPGVTSLCDIWTNHMGFRYYEDMTKARNEMAETWDWTATVKDVWGYDPELWEIGTAFWSDVPMFSGEEGNRVTAKTIGPMKQDVDVYLHMRPKKERTYTWVIEVTDPKDYTKKTQLEIASYTVSGYEDIDALSKQWYEEVSEKLEERYGISAEEPKCVLTWDDRGGYELFDGWKYQSIKSTAEVHNNVITEKVVPNALYMPLGVEDDDRYELYDGYFYETSYPKRFVERQSMAEKTVFAVGSTTLHYTWQTVYFADGAKRIAVRANIGEVPKVPEEFATVENWFDVSSRNIYTTAGLPVLYASYEKPLEYTAVYADRSLVFELPENSECDMGYGGEENVWKRSSLYLWKYRKVSDREIRFDIIYETAGGYTKYDITAPSLKMKDEAGLPLPADNLFWSGKNPVNGNTLTLGQNEQITHLWGVIGAIPKGGTVVFRPMNRYRAVKVVLKDSAAKLRQNGDTSFMTIVKEGDKLTAADVFALLKESGAAGTQNTVNTFNSYMTWRAVEYVTAIKDGNGLPYIFAGSDGGRVVLQDELAVEYEIDQNKLLDDMTARLSSRIDYADSGFHDEYVKLVIALTGKEGDRIDLTGINPVSPRIYTDNDGVRREYQFTGWKSNGSGKIVTTVPYGEDVTAQWEETGNIRFEVELVALYNHTFSDGSNKKTITVDPAKTLGEQPGYEEPLGNSSYIYEYANAFTGWSWEGMGEPALFADTSAKTLLEKRQFKIYGCKDAVFYIASESEIEYDGKPHQAIVGSMDEKYRENTTLEYSVDQRNWTAENPSFTQPGSYTVYVRGMKNGREWTEIAKTKFTIKPPIPVTVTVTGRHFTRQYDGNTYTTISFDYTVSDSRYQAEDFTFSGPTEEIGRYSVGTTWMGLDESQFANVNPKFDVTFVVTDGYATITPVDVVVKAKDATKKANAPEPKYTYTITGVLDRDKYTYQPTVSFKRDPGETPGTYTITPYGEEIQGNYRIRYETGTLTVTEADPVTPGQVTYRLSGSEDYSEWFVITSGDKPTETAGYGVDQSVSLTAVDGSPLPCIKVWEVQFTENDSYDFADVTDKEGVKFKYQGKEYSASELKNVNFESAAPYVDVKITMVDVTFRIKSGDAIEPFDYPEQALKGSCLHRRGISMRPADYNNYTWTVYLYDWLVAFDIDGGASDLTKAGLLQAEFSGDTTVTVKLKTKNYILVEDYAATYDENSHGVVLHTYGSPSDVQYSSDGKTWTGDSIQYHDTTNGPKSVWVRWKESSDGTGAYVGPVEAIINIWDP